MKQKLLILLAALLAAVSAHAFSYTHEGQTLNYLKTSDTTCKVISYKANASNGDYIIPTTVTYNEVEYTVTEIAEGAFKEYTGLISLVIPESVTTIGEYAFRNCSEFESLNIPNGVTAINNTTFYNCSNLKSIVIPESVTSIGNDAFGGCSSLTSIVIPESVTSIGQSAFTRCSNLTSIVIPESITSINAFVFKDCSNLTSVEIPESVTSIGQSAFEGCSSLTSIVIPESVTTIRQSAFTRCSSLASIEIPKSVINISSGAFSSCNSLETFYGKFSSEDHRCLIKNGELLAFAPLRLINYSIPKSVTSIGESAFYGSSLTSVVIPESVTSIGSNAFACSSLASVVIPESITSIGNSVFSSSSLTTIELPSSVTSIGPSAFSYCTSLATIVMPESVCSIGECAFVHCSSLSSIVIPESVTSIGSQAFGDCSSLTSIVIPESVTRFEGGAFNNCRSLKSIKLEHPDPAEITLGYNVFSNVDHQHCYLFVPKGSEELYANADQWKDFMKINYRVLNDGEAYQAEEDVEEPNVDYIREFKNTNWQPLYLPFAMNYDEWAPYADVAELYNVRGYDPDNDGEIDEVTIEFNRLKEGASIQPNIPYVIKAKETGKVTFECKDKLVTAAPATEGMVECSSTKFTYAFHGIYEEKTDLFSTGAYFLSTGDFYQAANENVKLAPYRAYLTVTPKTGGYNGDTTPAKAPQRITLVVDDEIETNGIDDIIDTAPHDDVYYDLMGRKVVNPTSGLYIQNGRKVYIK